MGSHRRALSLPPDSTLPFFSYGLFKPGELLYRQIEPFVAIPPVPATAEGVLWLRDGLPLLQLDTAGQARGYLITFRAEAAEQGYRTIAEFEPRTQYKWRTARLIDPLSQVANLLAGKRPDKGSVPFEGTEWSGRDDPVLREGLNFVRDYVDEYGIGEFQSAPPESFDWRRLFKLQMAYLFLWTILERYAALAYGPDLKPGEKVQALGQDRHFAESLSMIVNRKHRLFDSRDPAARKELDPADPRGSAKYYFQVRNNLTHRGKGAWKDGEIVRHSLLELLAIVERLVGQMREAAE